MIVNRRKSEIQYPESSIYFLRGGSTMGIRVGKAAPDFVAQAYWRGEIKEVRLSDYRGRWVLLFFYPADFTVV
jgi:hypothetical protein